MKKRLLCCFAVLFVLCLAACAAPASSATPEVEATPTPPQIVTFADPVLEKTVRAAMNKPEGDISVADAEGVKELKLSIEWQPQIPPETQIQDLSGLEYFKNLEMLDLSFHNIRDISPLAGLTKLTSLSLGGNPVEDITPLSGMTNLRELKLFNCVAEDYSTLAKFTKLVYLMLDRSGITDASMLSGLTLLSRLSLSGTQVSDVSPLAGLTGLQSLMLENCPITDYSPLAQIYPNLAEKDFVMVSSLRELGFSPIDNAPQVESYKTEKLIVQVHHQEWGDQSNPDEVNAVILCKDHGTENELFVIYYPDTKTYLVWSNAKDFRYTCDDQTGAINIQYGEENANAFVQAAYAQPATPLLLTPIKDFTVILNDTFGVTADVLYSLPREVVVIDTASLATLGFVAKQENAAYLYEQHEPQYYSIEVRNPVWGVWEEGGEVRFFTPLSDECRVVITYYSSERKYMVKADDNDGGGAGFYFYVDTNTHEDIWCTDKSITVAEYFTAAYNNPEISDLYEYSVQLMQNYIKDTFGLTVDELYALPAGQ